MVSECEIMELLSHCTTFWWKITLTLLSAEAVFFPNLLSDFWLCLWRNVESLTTSGKIQCFSTPNVFYLVMIALAVVW